MGEGRDAQVGLSPEKRLEFSRSQVVEHARRHHDRPLGKVDRNPGFEPVTHDELAVQVLGPCEPGSGRHKDGIEVVPNEFDLRPDRLTSCHRPQDVPRPAAKIDNANRSSSTPLAARDQLAKAGRDTAIELEFLPKALQLSVHADAQRVDIPLVEVRPDRRHPSNNRCGPPLPTRSQQRGWNKRE